MEGLSLRDILAEIVAEKKEIVAAAKENLL